MRESDSKTCRDCSERISLGRIVCDRCVLRVRSENGKRMKGRPSPLRGRAKSEETRRRMSAHALSRRAEMARRASGPKSPEFRAARAEDVRTGVSGFRVSKREPFVDRKGRRFPMRSEWERLAARWMDARELDWDYEPFVLKLPSGLAYLPDFKLADGRLVEVKGYMSPTCWQKIREARLIGYRVLIWDEPELKRLGILSSSGLKRFREAAGSTTSRPRPRTSTSKAS